MLTTLIQTSTRRTRYGRELDYQAEGCMSIHPTPRSARAGRHNKTQAVAEAKDLDRLFNLPKSQRLKH